MGQIGPRDHDDPSRASLDEVAHASKKTDDALVARRVFPRRLLGAKPRQDRHNPKMTALQQVLQEDDLELERMFSFMVELIGIRVEALGSSGQRINARAVSFDTAQRCFERLAAKSKGLAHGRVGCSENDECVGRSGKRCAHRAVGMAIACRPPPGVDVRRNETQHGPLAGVVSACRLCQAHVVHVALEGRGVGVVRTARVRRCPHARLREVTLDTAACSTKHRAFQKETSFEFLSQTNDNPDGHRGAQFHRNVMGDFLAGQPASETHDDGRQQRRKDGLRVGYALGVAEHEDAAMLAIRNDNRLDRA